MMANRVLPIFALFIAVGIFFVYINPTWTGSIAKTKATIESDNQALEAAHKYTDRQNELISARDAINPADLARLTNFLPDSVDNVSLILDLNALAARSGISLSNIDVSAKSTGSSDTVNTNPVGSIDLSLSAVGTYKAFAKFLRGVEESQRLLDVRNLAVTGSNSGLYTYSMTVRIYWLR